MKVITDNAWELRFSTRSLDFFQNPHLVDAVTCIGSITLHLENSCDYFITN